MADTVYFVKIITDVHGAEYIEYAGLRGEKTIFMIKGKPMKMKKIHGWKTIKGAEKFIESEKLLKRTELNQKFEIIRS